MLIEQNNGKYIDINNISELFYDRSNNHELEGKYIIVAMLKNDSKFIDYHQVVYLTNSFDNSKQAKDWIQEILSLNKFSQSLKAYR